MNEYFINVSKGLTDNCPVAFLTIDITCETISFFIMFMKIKTCHIETQNHPHPGKAST